MALPLERGHGERQRDAPALLLGVVVGDGGAVLDPPDPGGRAGAVEQGLGQRRLPRPAVAHQGDVADLRRWEGLHGTSGQGAAGVGSGQGTDGRRACRGRRAERPREGVTSRGVGNADAAGPSGSAASFSKHTAARRSAMFDGRFRTQAEARLRPVGANLRKTGITADHLTGLGVLMARGCRGGHRQRRPARRPAAPRAHRHPRRARRRGGQGLRHRLGPWRLLRLGGRPPHRRPALRRRRLVPRHHPARAHRGAAARRARRLAAHLLRAGQGRVARASTPAAA